MQQVQASILLLANEGPLKTKKNGFYFIVKAPFYLKSYLNFCLDILVMQENSLFRKVRLISKFMTSRSGKQTITIHILPNISRGKYIQMKFGQLLEYNMRNIFLEKPFTISGEITIPRPFYKKPKLSISLDQQSKVLVSLYLLYAKLRAVKTNWNQAPSHMLLPHIKLFKKQNDVWNQSPCLISSMIFE